MKRLPRGYWYARLKEFERVMNALVRDGLTDEERARARGGGAAVLGVVGGKIDELTRVPGGADTPPARLNDLGGRQHGYFIYSPLDTQTLRIHCPH